MEQKKNETKAKPKPKPKTKTEQVAKSVTETPKTEKKAKPKPKRKGVNSIMETNKMAKNVFDMQKTMFQNTYDAFTSVQDQAERAANMALDSAYWIPEEGTRALREWGQTLKQGREEWKRCVDENFLAVEKLFVTGAK